MRQLILEPHFAMQREVLYIVKYKMHIIHIVVMLETEMIQMDKNECPFGIKDKVGYMFGDLGNDFTFILSTMILMKFYSDVMGISMGVVGAMMMLARIVDAFTDVAMGQIVDRSRSTKAGKFKPWILRMCIPVALSSLLMYSHWIENSTMVFKTIWMIST